MAWVKDDPSLEAEQVFPKELRHILRWNVLTSGALARACFFLLSWLFCNSDGGGFHALKQRMK